MDKKHKKHHIEEMRNVAKEHGGLCLSNKYINNKTKLTWQCQEGHVWEARPVNIKIGQWCPKCSGVERLTIEEMQQIAQERGGKCLSEEYVNSVTKLKWQCREGHVWEARPGSIKYGQWCLKCSGSQKLTIEDMRQIAEERGGKCLSNKYINNKTKLTWQCQEGHVWEATPNGIKKGNWCPRCYNLKKKNLLLA